MAQQSARRGRKNQMYSSCLEHAFMIWFRSANSHTGPQLHRCIRGRTDGSIRQRANPPKNRLHLAGRPQMSTRPSNAQPRPYRTVVFDSSARVVGLPGPKYWTSGNRNYATLGLAGDTLRCLRRATCCRSARCSRRSPR